jgi:hypothetical protein
LADLDGDGDQEVLTGASAYHHDGTEYYKLEGYNAWAYAQVANLDADPDPEVIIIGGDIGITILEHDGTPKIPPTKPVSGDWRRPAAVHDFDGDGEAEIAFSVTDEYYVWERDLSILWQAPVLDQSGLATGTAFDFLGAGAAQAMYSDETTFHVFDGTGSTLMEVDRTSITHIEYPVVADVDNDGSAEVVVTSNYNGEIDVPKSPTVQVIRDREDRWIQARRIWNQHTYHVTNVLEDGTIPQYEQPSWENFNTYRTQVQIGGDGACLPPPQG